MTLNAHAARTMESIDATHASARARVAEVLMGPAERPEERLVRWIIENNINPYGVFASGWMARAMESYEGIVSVMQVINHALTDDGEITFVQTARMGPRIIEYWYGESDFREVFLKHIEKDMGHSPKVLEAFEPVGQLDNVQVFITAFEEKEKAYTAFCEKIEKRLAERRVQKAQETDVPSP